MNIYTPHAINVGTTFCLLLASAGLVSTCPPANTAGQRALLIERIMRPPKIGNVQEAEDKARAIDLLADERAAEAILPLIDCLSDTRALHGSDNWVGGHATNALEAITGQYFGTDIETWRQWYRDGGAKQPGSVLAPGIPIEPKAVRAGKDEKSWSPSKCPDNKREKHFEQPVPLDVLLDSAASRIIVKRFRGLPGSVNAGMEEIQGEVSTVWTGKFKNAWCYEPWAERVIWNLEIEIEGGNGERQRLRTDGIHVQIQDHDDTYWFLRLLPAAQ